jgi:hypothetical protein
MASPFYPAWYNEASSMTTWAAGESGRRRFDVMLDACDEQGSGSSSLL